MYYLILCRLVILSCLILSCLTRYFVSSVPLSASVCARVSLEQPLWFAQVSQTSLLCTGSILNPKPSTQALSWTCHTRSSSIPTRLLGLVVSFLSIRVEKSPNPLDRSARHRRPTTRRCKRLSAGRFVQTLNPHPLASVLSDSRA